jgi:hypothetical protein
VKLALAIIALAGFGLAAPQPALAAGEEPQAELSRFYFRLASGPRELNRMVQCLINQDVDGARALFDRPVFSEAQNQAVNAFGQHGSNCLFNDSDLRAAGLMYVGTIAEQMIDRDKPARPTRFTAPFGPSGQLGGGTHLWTWRALSQQNSARMIPLAYCLASRHTDQVEALLATRPYANGERTAFNALNDEIDLCVTANERWLVQPGLLRSALAIAYYSAHRASVNSAGDTDA